MSADEMMEYSEREPAPSLTPKLLAGQWYLQGFADAYSARVALTPFGPAGEQYGKGYSEGLAAVQRDFFAAMHIRSVVMEPAER